MDRVDKSKIKWAQDLARSFPISQYTSPENSKLFNTITLLLWQYAREQGLQEKLCQLAEPLEGNPPTINFEGRPISQDIANSLLEFDTIAGHVIPG